MDAKLSPHSPRRRRPWAVRPWTLLVLALLLAVGTLIQACSDNNGTSGPTFSCNENPIGHGGVRSLAACPQGGGKVPVVGAVGVDPATGKLNLSVAVTVNPGTIDKGRRGSVLVIVTSAHGAGIPDQAVQLTSTGGNLDATSGTTNGNGLFSTTIFVPCDTAAAAGSVTAIVDGVPSPGGSGAFTIVTATENNPCP
jgi:hypothetical protein